MNPVVTLRVQTPQSARRSRRLRLTLLAALFTLGLCIPSPIRLYLEHVASKADTSSTVVVPATYHHLGDLADADPDTIR